MLMVIVAGAVLGSGTDVPARAVVPPVVCMKLLLTSLRLNRQHAARLTQAFGMQQHVRPCSIANSALCCQAQLAQPHLLIKAFLFS